MRVFVTGATGFIGSAVVRELLGAGHRVLGLARSDAAEAALKEAGAEAHRGDLNDVDGLRVAADATDGVVHTGFVHDFSDLHGALRTELAALAAFGDALAGSGRPLVISSVTGLLTPGRLGTETDGPAPACPAPARRPTAMATASSSSSSNGGIAFPATSRYPPSAPLLASTGYPSSRSRSMSRRTVRRDTPSRSASSPPGHSRGVCRRDSS